MNPELCEISKGRSSGVIRVKVDAQIRADQSSRKMELMHQQIGFVEVPISKERYGQSKAGSPAGLGERSESASRE